MKAVSGLVALLMGVLLGGSVYLAYFFPKVISNLEAEGKALSSVQMMIANASIFCQSYWFLLLPILLVGLVGSLIWLFWASHES